MKMRKSVIFLLILCSALVITLASGEAAYAAQSVDEVFPPDEVTRVWAEAESKPLLPDKTEIDGAVSTRSMGTYPRRRGVILVTDDKLSGLIPTGHAAIVYNYGTVVESLALGVTTGQNNWYSSHGTCKAVTVNATSNAQDAAAADWCYGQIGKLYNFNYLYVAGRDRFYCSQLVWAAFLDLYGIDLNTNEFGPAIHPAELVATPKTTLIYEK